MSAERPRRVIAFLLVIAISAGIIAFRQQLVGLAAYGYPGLFLVSLFASATVFLPMPGLALVCAAGTGLTPILVGLAAGSGAAVGELTGYLAGYSGRGIVENQATYRQVQRWMEQYGLWVIFVLGLVPNPLFDIAGITAGIMRIEVWKFLLATWAGNVIKASLVAYACAGTMALIAPLIQRWLAR